VGKSTRFLKHEIQHLSSEFASESVLLAGVEAGDEQILDPFMDVAKLGAVSEFHPSDWMAQFLQGSKKHAPRKCPEPNE
jgi:hypothetical protein